MADAPSQGLRARLRPIIEDGEGWAGRAFMLLIQLLILASLVTFAIETLPDLDPEARWWLRVAEITFVSIFTLEYLLRLWVAERRRAFVFSFYGLVDLLAILPFYLRLTVDLRSVRVLRLLRLFRVFKLVRYNDAVRRFRLALRYAFEELVLFLTATMLLIYLCAVGIYYFENAEQPDQFASIFDGLWWAVASLTTVGYGDIYPVTVGGKLFTFVVLMLGLSIVAVPAGLISSALSKAREQLDAEAGDEVDPEAGGA